jgi:hypothetical protein
MAAAARRLTTRATLGARIAMSPTIPDRTAANSPTVIPATTTTPDPRVAVMEAPLTVTTAMVTGMAEGEEEEEDADVDGIGDRARTYQGFGFQS